MESPGLEESIVVWLVEDDEQYGKTLSNGFKKTLDIKCREIFADCESILNWLDTDENWSPADVILLDIRLPGLSGIEAIQHLKARVPETHIVMLTIIDKPETIYDALRAGASGYLLKNSPLDQIIAAVREASRGGMLMPSGVAEKVLSFFAQTHTISDYRLTPREMEVLEQMVLGHSQKEIATQLFISSHTVNCHIQNIYDKLHVHSGVEAVSKTLRERLI